VDAAGAVQSAAAAGAAAQQDAFGYAALQQQQQQAGPLLPPQQQQQQEQLQLQLLPVKPGIMVIKDAASMERLVATLAAAPSWGFSLHLDQPAPAAAAAGGAVRVKKNSNSSRKNPCTAAAGPGPAAAAAGASTQWRWDVLGAAFSTSDGSAFYVPLYVSGSGVSRSKDITVRRGSSPAVLQQMWAGLQAIFSSSSQQQQQQQQEAALECTPGAYLQSRVAELAASARAAADGSGRGSDAAQANSAAAAVAANSSWLTPAPVAVTFGAKQALKLLSDPPAASGLPGLRLCGSLVDVRVAAWLLAPEASVVEESVGSPGCK
jgi:hypothetical protein